MCPPISIFEAPKQVNTAAVVVLFHPEGDLIQRLECLIAQVSMLFIVVNDGLDAKRINTLNQKKIRYIDLGHNLGLASALNRGLSLAIEQGYLWCVVLDQDTIVDGNLLSGLAETWRACPYREHAVMLAPNYRSPSGSRIAYPTNSVWQFVQAPVTSGSLIYTAIIAQVGGMRENFFIEGIDIEFALRLRSFGLQVVASGLPLMTHGAGAAEERRFFGRTITVTHHSPSRYFLQYRNLAWIMRRYRKQESLWCRTAIFSMAKRCCIIILFERQRLHKLWAILNGICVGLMQAQDFGKKYDC